MHGVLVDQANAIHGLMSPNCHVDGSFDCVDATVFIHVSATPDTKCTPFTSDCLYGWVGNMYQSDSYEYRVAATTIRNNPGEPGYIDFPLA